MIAQANGLLLTLVTPGRLQVSKQIAELHQEQNPITEIQHLLCARWRSILVMIIANYLPIQVCFFLLFSCPATYLPLFGVSHGVVIGVVRVRQVHGDEIQASLPSGRRPMQENASTDPVTPHRRPCNGGEGRSGLILHGAPGDPYRCRRREKATISEATPG